MPDKVPLFHFAKTIEPGFPHIDGIGNFVSVERQLGLESKGITSPKSAWDGVEWLAGLEQLVPHPRACRLIAGDVNLESVFPCVPRARHQRVLQPANRTVRQPIKLDRREIGVSDLLQQVDALGPLNGNLREIIRQILHAATKLASVLLHPGEVLLARARIDHQQIFFLAKPMHDHIVDEGSLGIKQRRVLRLPNREAGSVVHGNVFDSGERPWPGESDIAHVADVKNADPGAHCQVLGDNAGVLNRHIPAVELDHFCAQFSMNGVQRSLSGRGCGFDRIQKASIIGGGWAADGKPIKITCGWEVFNRLYSPDSPDWLAMSNGSSSNPAETAAPWQPLQADREAYKTHQLHLQPCRPDRSDKFPGKG